MSKIKCLNCDMILESKFRWDFQSCDCPNNTFIDGGDDYIRFGCMDITKVLFWDEEKNEFVKYNTNIKEIINEEQEEEIKCYGDCLKHCPENK